MARSFSVAFCSAPRRAVLAGGVSAAAALTLPAAVRAAPLDRLVLYGPPAGPSITLAHAVARGALKSIAADVSLSIWRNPDELRAGLTSGAIELSVVPVQAAANLYNRGMGLRLVNAMTDGLYYVVAARGRIGGLDELAGKRLAVPFVNDTPDFVLRALLAQHGLTDRVTLAAAGSPTEAAQLLLAGKLDAALLSEPAASVVLVRGKAAGLDFVRAVDLQEAWGRISGLGPVLPQAGLAVTRRFFETRAELLEPLQQALEQVTAAVNADPAAAAADASGPLELPAPVLAASIPHARLTAKRARSVGPAIESMLKLMASRDAAIIGGKLPDDGFYAL